MERSIRMSSAFLSWGSLGFIAFATLSPIDLRPHLASTGLEHVGAYAVLALFLGLAYPRRPLRLALLLVLAACALEAAQLVLPDRHARWADLGTKLAGAGIGLALALALNLAIERLRPRRAG
jgi:VanZ family protein